METDMADTPTLVRFVSGWAAQGLGADGMPLYRETINVIKERPPYLRVEHEATEQDFDDNPGPYQLFLKEQGAKAAQPTATGFPLALWSAASPAALRMLAARDIVTVEQLAKRAQRGADDGMPADLKELAVRAKQMLEMSKDIGQYEAIIRERDAQIVVLREQVSELQTSIKMQDGIINSLKLKVA